MFVLAFVLLVLAGAAVLVAISRRERSRAGASDAPPATAVPPGGRPAWQDDAATLGQVRPSQAQAGDPRTAAD